MYWNKKLDNEIYSFPTNFIFGYGSLINDTSRNSNCEFIHEAIPARISPEFGYRRVWNYKNPTSQMYALGLESCLDSTKASTINGVIFPVIEKDLHKFNERELNYSLKEIPKKMIETLSWIKIPEKSNIWTYIPILNKSKSDYDSGSNSENTSRADYENPICQSYIDLCLEGCLKYGEDFATEFLDTTFSWNQDWINDRLIPRRPWIYQPLYNKIDTLLQNNPQSQAYFDHRKIRA